MASHSQHRFNQGLSSLDPSFFSLTNHLQEQQQQHQHPPAAEPVPFEPFSTLGGWQPPANAEVGISLASLNLGPPEEETKSVSFAPTPVLAEQARDEKHTQEENYEDEEYESDSESDSEEEDDNGGDPEPHDEVKENKTSPETVFPDCKIVQVPWPEVDNSNSQASRKDEEDLYNRFAKIYESSKKQKVGENEDSKSAENGNAKTRSRGAAATTRRSKKAELPPQRTILREMEHDCIVQSATILLVGKRRSGKSVAIQDNEIKQGTPRIVVIGKGRDVKSWDGVVPRIYISKKFDESYFQGLMKDQEQLLNLKEQPGNEDMDIRLSIILEDFSSDAKVMRSDALADLVSNGRRLHITFYCSAQYLKNLRPNVRTQIDYFFLFKEKNKKVRKDLCEAVASNYESDAYFLNLLDSTTKERRVLVIDTVTDADDQPEDFTYWYKARRYKPRALGSFKYRLFHNLYYRPEDAPIDVDVADALDKKASEPVATDALQRAKVHPFPIGIEVPTSALEEACQEAGVFEVAVAGTRKTGPHIISFRK